MSMTEEETTILAELNVYAELDALVARLADAAKDHHFTQAQVLGELEPVLQRPEYSRLARQWTARSIWQSYTYQRSALKRAMDNEAMLYAEGVILDLDDTTYVLAQHCFREDFERYVARERVRCGR